MSLTWLPPDLPLKPTVLCHGYVCLPPGRAAEGFLSISAYPLLHLSSEKPVTGGWSQCAQCVGMSPLGCVSNPNIHLAIYTQPQALLQGPRYLTTSLEEKVSKPIASVQYLPQSAVGRWETWQTFTAHHQSHHHSLYERHFFFSGGFLPTLSK